MTGASGSATYCWCRADAFTPTSGSECEFAPQPWVFNHGFNSTTDCSETCASECAQFLRGMPGFRDALYNVAPAPACTIPSTDVSNAPNAYAAKRLNGGTDYTYGGATAATYGITQPGEWGVSWSNGDKVTGVALCSQTSGTYQNTGTPDETGSGETKYCWCKATHYTANSAQQCSLSSPSCVFYGDRGAVSYCAGHCADNCATGVLNGSAFRAAVFTGLVAQ